MPSSMKVSTVMIGMPASLARRSGSIIWVLSVGAIRMASGPRAITASSTGVCRTGSNSSAPWKSTVMPSASAAAWAPRFIVM